MAHRWSGAICMYMGLVMQADDVAWATVQGGYRPHAWELAPRESLANAAQRRNSKPPRVRRVWTRRPWRPFCGGCGLTGVSRGFAAHMGGGAAAMHPLSGASATTIAVPAFAARMGSKPRPCGHTDQCQHTMKQTGLIA